MKILTLMNPFDVSESFNGKSREMNLLFSNSSGHFHLTDESNILEFAFLRNDYVTAIWYQIAYIVDAEFVDLQIYYTN